MTAIVIEEFVCEDIPHESGMMCFRCGTSRAGALQGAWSRLFIRTRTETEGCGLRRFLHGVVEAKSGVVKPYGERGLVRIEDDDIRALFHPRDEESRRRLWEIARRCSRPDIDEIRRRRDGEYPDGFRPHLNTRHSCLYACRKHRYELILVRNVVTYLPLPHAVLRNFGRDSRERVNNQRMARILTLVRAAEAERKLKLAEGV